ncbi:phosphomethylpyrimidine synthase ThiC [Syntrophomonas palmitatica]|uniref:phosphomethylpyrimidine synthase ThiC n=1 Tax=Syntrophomonas palmitatica TaxID=402877 RepID=UPI0006D0F191|nr:phosphomethylpyrimidine synthase ThiC [Syntrophomonas palmitatica]
MNYKTQREAASKAIITPEMQRVAKEEKMDPGDLCSRMAAGQIVIPANHNHRSLEARGIGAGLKTKINVNLGISRDCCDWAMELLKVETALKMQADAIMDLSSYGDSSAFRQRLIAISGAMIGTVPIYDAMAVFGKPVFDLASGDFLRLVEIHARDGVDFMTIHAGLNLAAVERLHKNRRLTSIVSRGGSMLYAWMNINRAENPFYEHFDELLEICREYDVTLSLGDACRPGCLHDATDAAQVEELISLGELTLRAWEKDVQVIIEGPGHMAINEIAANMVLQKKLCHGAPFYVLGPLVTDIAPGYDHITSAIGGAIAAYNGADFLCYVTPAEHLRLPNLEDMAEGINASRIAAHAADIAKGIPGAAEWDYKMSEARSRLDWETMFALALDPDKASRYRAESGSPSEETCTMCGELCAVRTMKEFV